MKRIQSLLIQVRCSRWAALSAAVLGALVYLAQAVRFMHTLPSILDEGNYLYKGLLFARGVYYPFQPYGPWTNKMPLAFLIPGWAQALFGPGLRTGRIYAIALALILLLALWITARRFNGRWWAAASIFFVALAPGVITVYTQAWSQGLIAAMLAVTLALVLGAGRPLWQLLAGSALAALMVMTRQNMLPVVGLVVLYIAWEYGWRKGLYSAAAAFVVLLVGHIIYWPGILSIWQPWLPFKLTALTGGARQAAAGSFLFPLMPSLALPSLQDFVFKFLFPLLDPLHHYFVPLVGLLAALVFWPRRADWPSPSRFRAAVLLAVMFALLFAMHAWAALGHDYCPYCLDNYMAFYSPAGLLLVVVSAPAWQRRLSAARSALAVLAALLVGAAVGFVSYTLLGGLLTLQIPRVTGMRIQPGTTDLWRSLSNKFGLSYEVLQRLIPAAAGMLAAALLVALAFIAARAWRSRGRRAPSGGFLALASLLALGAALSPITLLGGWNIKEDCGGDVIAAYEQAGAQLAQTIPPGALVFWRGGLSPAPLLYLPEARIFPPLLNDTYSKVTSANSDAAYRKGLWTPELSNAWLEQADYILVEDKNYKGSIVKKIDPAKYNELEATQPISACRSNSKIRVFRREK